ncbi:uncharacterized protein LOC101466477 isoform X3 [Maylandia zebra]
MCLSSENIENLIEGIERFNIKEGEPSVFIDSEQSAALYITHSGSDESVGIQKFGKAIVRPKNHDKEQHYVGLVLSKREEDPSQNRLYGFYREKSKDNGLFREMWLPFVTRVCMADVGGPKNNLQFTWTSQMNARLFCGDRNRKQHFSELVDVSTVDADRWQDTKIYALFRNEWGMSAVCIYTIGDIDKIFTNSPFKGYTKAEMDRPRTCVDDSTKLPVETLKKIEKTSEMEQLVHPVGNSGLLLFNHQSYTHIQIDGSPNRRTSHHTVIFLSLNNGGIHKVLHNKNDTFLIAEFRPFNYTEQISFILHPSSKKLYVNNGSQLVQLDVADCSQYGDTCQDCMLSRDPYCGWDGTQCIRDTNGIWHDAATGNLAICQEHAEKEAAMNRLDLPHDPPVRIFLKEQPDTVLAVGKTYLNTYIKNQKKNQRRMRLENCNSDDCSYNITLAHLMEDANQLFVCGTTDDETVCCNSNLAEQSPICKDIKDISSFNINEGDLSALAESEQSTDLYITRSGSDGSVESVGIHKFGKARVGPKNHHKEQHYVGLVLSKREEDPSQNRVYGFYKEKTEDTGLFSEMWLPFVTQVCMTDVGGPKNNLQFTWTSQMNARLFCGDQERKQHFSELVDVSTVDADRWQDTKIYALFRNEWGMSAVCVYTIEDINKIFENSPFNGYKKDQMDRPRTCAPDSSKLSVDTLKKIEKISEMEQLVHPVGNPGLLFFNHHNYTHIQVDSKPNSRSSNQNVIFLSLNNGGIHKVLQNESHTFVIAEYQPFKQKAHVLSIILQSTFKKLYVNNGSQLVQLDVADCSQYGDTCQDCMLSRDPYCGWDGTQCIRETKGSWHDAATGDLSVCNEHNASNYTGDPVPVPRYSKYFLQCPVSSRHAQYSWQHDENSTACSSVKEQCLYLIDNMDSECKGTYKCISQEMGYSKVLVQYELQVENDAKTQQYRQLWPNKAEGRKTSPVIWVCVMMALIKSLSF